MFFSFPLFSNSEKGKNKHSKYPVLLIHFHEVVLLVCLKSNQQWDLLCSWIGKWMVLKCWIRKKINSIISDQNRAQNKEQDCEFKWEVVTEAGKIIDYTVWDCIPFFFVHNTFISRLLYMDQITISGPWVRTYLSIRVPDELFISLCIIHDVQLVS